MARRHHAVERRHDLELAFYGGSLFALGTGSLDGRLGRLEAGTRGIERGRAEELALDEAACTGKFATGIAHFGLGLPHPGLRSRKRSRRLGRIDAGQHLAAADTVAGVDGECKDPPLHLRSNGDLMDSLYAGLADEAKILHLRADPHGRHVGSGRARH